MGLSFTTDLILDNSVCLFNAFIWFFRTWWYFHAYPSSWGIIGNNLRQYYDKIADYFAMYFPHILVISMAAYFGAIEKAPFTAIMLLTEMIGTVQQVLPMIIVTFVAYYILDILGGKPIYEALRLQMNYHKNIDK